MRHTILTLFSALIALLILIPHEVVAVPSNKKRQTVRDEYDFIIAGGNDKRIPVDKRLELNSFLGGTAGLVLGNRLSESGKHSVLVLEAGPEPTVVAAYQTPGGNQYLGGMLRPPTINISDFAKSPSRLCDRLELLYRPTRILERATAGIPS